MNEIERNRGAILLAKTGNSQSAIATVCGVSRVAVSYWISGRNKPDEAMRSLISKHFKIPVGAWDLEECVDTNWSSTSKPCEFGNDPKTNTKATVNTLTDILVSSDKAESASEMREVLKRLKTVRNSPSYDDLALQIKIRIEDLTRSTSLALSKVTGEGSSSSLMKIKRSKAWRSIENALCKALASYPDALKEVTNELRSIEE